MRKTTPGNRRPADVLISFFVLGILLWFTYGYLFEAPYAGFYFNPSNSEILQIYQRKDPAADLQPGDFIERIGSITWEEYQAHRDLGFFEGFQPGQTIEIVIQRDGENHTLQWVFAGFNQSEFLDRLFNVWWLAYAFWFFGMAAQLFMRPRDIQWQLLIAANYLTGLFIVFGNFSTWHMWGTSALLHAITWLLLPVYIQFHWIFPTPLRGTSHWGWIIFYGASLLLAAGELILSVPRSLYFLGVITAFGGSFILLVYRFIRQPDQRREIGLLAASVLLAFLPAISVSLFGTAGQIPQIGPLALLSLPIMPGIYFYVVYRRRLGGLELRANRAISIFAFLILLSTMLLLLIGLIGPIDISQEAMTFATIVAAGLTAYLTVLTFPAFQIWVERRILGIKLPYQKLPETYSSRIITSASLSDLLRLLDEELIPSLLIRQFAFIHLSNPSSKALLVKGITDAQLPGAEDIDKLVGSAERIPVSLIPNDHPPLSWIRLILLLKIGEDLIGLWLLGRRDPDDLYPQAEIPILRSLANQTAIALSNILQTERLRNLYQENINRYEQERLRLALDLHDSVLNQMAVLAMNLDPSSVSPKFKEAYDELTQRLREIVSDLRPPMLQYGLKPAFEGLSDNLMERSSDRVNVMLDIQATEERYPQNTELHLFRMVQEACENALHHGQAGKITISGQLDPQRIQLKIEDDGLGFEAEEILDLNSLLANRHFGLAGLVERANLIGAQLQINSAPNAGTQIRILLDVPQDEVSTTLPAAEVIAKPKAI